MGGVWHARLVLGAYIHGVPIFVWVPIFGKELVRTEMGAYIHGVPIFMGYLLSRFYGSLKPSPIYARNDHLQYALGQREVWNMASLASGAQNCSHPIRLTTSVVTATTLRSAVDSSVYTVPFMNIFIWQST